MGAATHLTAADRRWLSPLLLWAGIFAGPVAWALDLEASYALVQWTCATQRMDVLHAVSVVALVITMGGAALSWMALQHARGMPMDAGSERARARFMAVLGLSASLLFATAILAGSLPRWMLDACQ